MEKKSATGPAHFATPNGLQVTSRARHLADWALSLIRADSGYRYKLIGICLMALCIVNDICRAVTDEVFVEIKEKKRKPILY